MFANFFHDNAKDSRLVFLSCTITIKELPVHSENLKNDIHYHMHIPVKQNEQLVTILVKMIDVEHFAREVSTSTIKTHLRHFIASKFTTCE